MERGGLRVLAAGAERTEFGAVLLPDESRFGFGPLYWAVFEATGTALRKG